MVAEQFVHVEYLVDDLLRAPDEQRTPWTGEAFVVLARDLPAIVAVRQIMSDISRIMRIEFVERSLAVPLNMEVAGYSDLAVCQIVSRFAKASAIEIDEGPETRWFPANWQD
jgi:hypothetical protein